MASPLTVSVEASGILTFLSLSNTKFGTSGSIILRLRTLLANCRNLGIKSVKRWEPTIESLPTWWFPHQRGSWPSHQTCACVGTASLAVAPWVGCEGTRALHGPRSETSAYPSQSRHVPCWCQEEMFQMLAICYDLRWKKYLSISSMSSGTSGLCVLKQSRSSLSAIELMHRFWRLFGLSVVPWVPNLSLKPADVPYMGKEDTVA